VIDAISFEPLVVARGPVQPPEAVQEVAFAEVQVRVDAPPLAILVGEAVKVEVGTGATVTTTLAWLLLPPGPVQINK
jgi:hypothetical protein